MRPMSILAALTILISSALASDTVAPGLPAPKITVKKWIKGKPIKSFAPGKTYVVEFWATWCGPCVASMPHLSELARKNKDVTFVGVGIWEDNPDGRVEKFVQGMGEKMDYNVAYSGNKEGMSETWMKAAGQNGIPTSFIVKDRKVVWIGHPMGMDKALAEVKAGKFDVVAFRKQYDKDQIESKKQSEAYREVRKIEDAYRAGKQSEAKTRLAAVVKRYPPIEDVAKGLRFAWLAKENPAAWEIEAMKMVEKKQSRWLNDLAYRAATVDKDETLARKAIALGLAATPDDVFTLWYAADVYKAFGDYAAALQMVNDASAKVKSSPYKNDESILKGLVEMKTELESKVLAAKK